MNVPDSIVVRLHGLPICGTVRVKWPPPPTLEFAVRTVNVGSNGEAGLLAVKYTRSVHWRGEEPVSYYQDDDIPKWPSNNRNKRS